MSGKHRIEQDVPTDPAMARTRATGGVEDPSQPDQGSTTGTTPSGTFVGRVAGQDVGYVGQTGAEARAAEARRRADRRQPAPQDRPDDGGRDDGAEGSPG